MTASVVEGTAGYLLCHFHDLGCEWTAKYLVPDQRLSAVVERDEHTISCEFRPRGKHWAWPGSSMGDRHA